MKKLWQGVLFVVGFAALGIGFDMKAQADTGKEAAVRIEVGSYVETRKITVSSSTLATLASASSKRPDLTCFNNTPYTLWIGSAAAGTTLPDVGFPILSSATFMIGSMTGEVSGLLDSASGAATYTGDVRCFDGLVR